MKPGLKTIIAGAVLILLGALVLPLLMFFALLFGESAAVQFKAPGTLQASVKEPGRYYLWNDFRTVYHGKSYDRSEHIPDGLEIQVRDANGRELPFVSDTSISSTRNSSAKNSIGYVEVGSPGKLEIEVSGVGEERVFSFSQFSLIKLFGQVAGGAGLCFVVGFMGLGLTIWGVVKLVRASRRTIPGGEPPVLTS